MMNTKQFGNPDRYKDWVSKEILRAVTGRRQNSDESLH